MPTLSDKEKLDWLQLIRTHSIGPITFDQLLARYGSAGDAIKSLPDIARNAGRAKTLRPASRHACEDEIIAADQIGAKLIARIEDGFPAPLRAIPDCPPLIYVRGHISLFEKPAIGIVGARNASGVGCKIARDLAHDLGANGFAVVSGLARGIDGAAHQASLETGTIAVVAGGVDHVYPPEHDELMDRIAQAGIIVSEQPIGAKPYARDFPKRNRLISGLSRGIVVVEAAKKSGTLITARFALEQGREVFAVPGSPLDPRCHGANRLISDGATLTQSADDIIDQLKDCIDGVREDEDLWQGRTGPASAEPAESPADRKALREAVLMHLNFTPLHRDEIIRQLGQPIPQIADALLELVLAGEAFEHPGGCFSLSEPG